MSFLEDLKNGKEDIRLNISDRFKLLDEFQLGVNLLDTNSQLFCHIGKSHRMLDLKPENNELLFADIDKISFADFKEYFAKTAENQEEEPSTNRTDWNPVIDVKIIDIDKEKNDEQQRYVMACE